MPADATRTPPFPEPQQPQLLGNLGLYLPGDHYVRVTSFGSLAGVNLAIEGRFLNLDGRVVDFQQRHVPNSDRSSASATYPVGTGWLQQLTVRASTGSPRRGQVFVVVELVRGQTSAAAPVGLLVQGYVTDTSRIAWPNSWPEGMTDGHGVLRSITGTDQAAGVEFSEAVPTNARWHLISLSVELVGSSAAANREFSLVIDDGATVIARIPSGVTQTASQTIDYFAYVGAARNTVAQDTARNLPLPTIDLQGGYRIRSVTTAIQAGDNWGAPQLFVEEWIED